MWAMKKGGALCCASLRVGMLALLLEVEMDCLADALLSATGAGYVPTLESRARSVSEPGAGTKRPFRRPGSA
jgi:hypothetical protein